jgi:hypothetical protein
MMAKINGWKKIKDDPTWVVWEFSSRSSYYGDNRVSVAKMYSDKILANTIKKEYSWVVSYGQQPSVLNHMIYATKKEALASAMKYMRGHPNG